MRVKPRWLWDGRSWIYGKKSKVTFFLLGLKSLNGQGGEGGGVGYLGGGRRGVQEGKKRQALTVGSACYGETQGTRREGRERGGAGCGRRWR